MDIDVLFDLWLDDIDSVPYTREDINLPVGDLRTEATP